MEAFLEYVSLFLLLDPLLFFLPSNFASLYVDSTAWNIALPAGLVVATQTIPMPTQHDTSVFQNGVGNFFFRFFPKQIVF